MAVLAGTILSTAILTGALIIGDSVKLSLSELVDMRLGKVEYAMQTGDRFVSQELAQSMSEELGTDVVSVLQGDGIAINPESSLRQNRIHIYGINTDFWNLSNLSHKQPKADEVYLGENLAQQLDISLGNEILIRVEKTGFIPSNTPFVKEDETNVALRLKVSKILSKEEGARFSLKNNQSSPFNVFVNIDALAKEIGMDHYANLFLSGDQLNADALNQSIKNNWKLKDAGLVLEELADSSLQLRLQRIFIEPEIASALANIDSKHEILSYLVNGLKSEQGETPYSFVSGLSKYNDQLKDHEIIINQWLADDLEVEIGDSLEMKYFVIGPFRRLDEASWKFQIKDILPVLNDSFDSTFMPPFPGLADAQSCGDWETGVPIDLERIRDKDEAYWNEFKGTPKAVISYNLAENIWGNRFGDHTALRFDRSQQIDQLSNSVLSNISPSDLNLEFIAVREIGNTAVNNAISFGELFLSLSFFVIVAGILLTALLYALSLESRKQEYGVLAALGFRKRKIKFIQLLESLPIILLGSTIGAIVGIFYNYLLMQGINHLWTDIVRTNELNIHVLPTTLMIGAFSGMFIAFIMIFLMNRKKLKTSITSLLKSKVDLKINTNKRRLLYRIIMIVCYVLVALMIAMAFTKDILSDADFMMASGAFLIASFAAIRLLLDRFKQRRNSLMNIRALVLRNISLNQSRSLAVIFLLAIGCYTILITGANRKTFYGMQTHAQSGTGGYAYWVESTIPILQDLNNAEYKLDGAFYHQFHVLEGDDASCLNLNQVQQPRILGVETNVFRDKNAFSFTKLIDGFEKDKAWNELNKELAPNVIPAYADQTVITWGLLKKVGDTLNYKTESGAELKIVLAGGLQTSVFQGNLLISDAHFTKYFPSVSGSKVMLVDSIGVSNEGIEDFLSFNYSDYGLEIQSAPNRLAEFNSVTNTYLSVFMILGGLGILIGTIGLGVVIIRNMTDRKHELGLYQALGIKQKTIFKLIYTEHLSLLIIGSAIGLISAAVGIIPSLISKAFEMQWAMVVSILILIFLNGIFWIYFSTKRSLKSELIQSLKED